MGGSTTRKIRPRFSRNVFLQYLFLVMFVSGLAGWTYWLKPREIRWIKNRETAELRKRLKDSMIPYTNNPWSESFRLGADKIYVLRRRLEQSVQTETVDLPSAVPTVEALPRPAESVAFAFTRSAEEKRVRRMIWTIIDQDGTLLDAAVYEKTLRGDYRKILTDEPEFFGSIKGRTRNHLFLTEDDGAVTVLKKGTAFSRDILDGIRRNMDFYWDHQDAMIKGAEDAHAVG